MEMWGGGSFLGSWESHSIWLEGGEGARMDAGIVSLGAGRETVTGTHRGAQVFSQGGADCAELSFLAISCSFRSISLFTALLDLKKKKKVFSDLLSNWTRKKAKHTKFLITLFNIYSLCTIYKV